jgi:hypothetical protein
MAQSDHVHDGEFTEDERFDGRDNLDGPDNVETESERRQRTQQRAEAPRGDGSFGTSYLNDVKSDESWQQWRQIQSNFVDDPRRAVAEAHGLVGDLMNTIVRQFEAERGQLEQRWSKGEDVDTEELRNCLQRYRDFFGRLLTNVGDAKH